MRTVVLSNDNIISFLNENFINTWVANADLGRSGSLHEPIAMRRKREGITFDTNNPLVRSIMKGGQKVHL